jgi:hypothetical protein
MKASIKILHWAPRIICILAILFISIFAADSFAPELTIWQQISGFIIHLIPSFVLLIILIVSWKRELFGGIFFTLIGIVLTPFIYTLNYSRNDSIAMSIGIVSMITLPFIIVGVLFLMSYFTKKKYRKTINEKTEN